MRLVIKDILRLYTERKHGAQNREPPTMLSRNPYAHDGCFQLHFDAGKMPKKKPPQARHNIYKIWRCDNVEETSLATQFVIGTLRKKASPDVPCSFASLRL